MYEGPSLRLARHIVDTPTEALPLDATHAARRSLLDAMGVMLAAGTIEEGCLPFVELSLADGGPPESSILGRTKRVSAANAAFANGAFAHALDFEDAHDLARVHPYAATVAAALAVAQAKTGVDTRELVAALVVGSDLVCRLGLALLVDPVERGWYMAPILGAFGATAAAGRLLRLTPEQLVDAFSLTLCQATCTAEAASDPESVIRAVRDAFAARAGVVSAQLAARGTSAFAQPFEGRAGLFELYAPGQHDLGALTRDLGVDFEGSHVAYKPWPCCRGTHAHIEAALLLAERNELDPADIRSIRLGLEDTPVMRLLSEPIHAKRSPRTAIDGKFSLPFTVAVALSKRTVTLDAFTRAGLEDVRVGALAGLIECSLSREHGFRSGWVEVGTDGAALRVDTPADMLGSPARPMSDADLQAKFRQCARHSVTPITAPDLELAIAMMMDPDDGASVDDLVSLLCPAEEPRKEDHAVAR